MKNTSKFFSFPMVCLVAAMVAGGCRTPAEKKVVKLTNEAADKLAGQLLHNPQRSISKQDPILVATVADVDRLETSSSLGRITAEQIASRLGQLGFNVTEVKVRGNLFVQRERGEFKNAGSPFGGEFVLSRNIEQIAAEHDAAAIVAGTYAVGKTHTIISLRAIEVASKRILAGYDYAVPAVPWQWVNLQPEEKKKYWEKY